MCNRIGRFEIEIKKKNPIEICRRKRVSPVGNDNRNAGYEPAGPVYSQRRARRFRDMMGNPNTTDY